MRFKEIFLNGHFWAILFIVCGVAFLYYSESYPAYHKNETLEVFWYLLLVEFSLNLYGLLFIIPMLYAAVVFGWYGVAIATLLCLVLIFPFIINWNGGISRIIINIFILSLPSILIGFATLYLSIRKRNKKIMEEKAIERQLYMAQIFEAHEDERQHLAHELHDDILQKLLIIANQIQSLASEEYGSITSSVKDKALSIKNMVLGLSTDTRNLSLGLRPSILDNFGLLPALAWLVNRLQESENIETSLVITGTPFELDSESDVMIFRIVQESLNNIKKHARATQVVVSLLFEKPSIKLSVRDNGKGFMVPETINHLAVNGKLGLLGMQQRAQLLGGSFNISSDFEKGTEISLEITR